MDWDVYYVWGTQANCTKCGRAFDFDHASSKDLCPCCELEGKLYHVKMSIQDIVDPAYGTSVFRQMTKKELVKWCEENAGNVGAGLGITCVKINDHCIHGSGSWGWYNQSDEQKLAGYVQHLL